MPTRFRRAAVAVVACAALACALPRAAFALTAADTAALAGDDFDAKTSAIERIAADADPRAVALLNALSTGDALATGDGRLLIQTGDTAHDALTQAATPAGDAQPVMLNNLLRTKIAAALSGLALASPDVGARRDAIDALLKSPTRHSSR